MKTVLAMLIAVVALATMSAADVIVPAANGNEIDFPSSKYVVYNTPVTADGALGTIALDPTRDIVWVGGMNVNLATGYMSSTYVQYQGQVDFDKMNDAWAATDSGLVHKYVSGAASKRYFKADGLPSNYIFWVKYDSVYNRLVVGTDSGVSIVQLDASENPSGFSNALSYMIHFVAVSGKNVFAVNTSHLFYYDGVSWTTCDSTNSPILESCWSGAVDHDGNFYISTACIFPGTIRAKAVIAKFDPLTKTWESINMTMVDDSLTGINQVRVDCNDQLWCTFPKICLVQVDLATHTVVGKSPLNGTSKYPWLNESTCGGEPAIGSTKGGGIIVGGNGKVVIGNSSNAVIYRLAPPKMERGNFQFVGWFNASGRLISKTFSNNSLASGINFPMYRTPDGKTMRVEKTPVIR